MNHLCPYHQNKTKCTYRYTKDCIFNNNPLKCPIFIEWLNKVKSSNNIAYNACMDFLDYKEKGDEDEKVIH